MTWTDFYWHKYKLLVSISRKLPWLSPLLRLCILWNDLPGMSWNADTVKQLLHFTTEMTEYMCKKIKGPLGWKSLYHNDYSDWRNSKLHAILSSSKQEKIKPMKTFRHVINFRCFFFFWNKIADIHLNRVLNNLWASRHCYIMPSGTYSYYNYDPEEIFLNSNTLLW